MAESTGAPSQVRSKESGKCPHCGRPLLVFSLDMLGSPLSLQPACLCVLEKEAERRKQELAHEREALLERRGFNARVYAGMTLENWQRQTESAANAYNRARNYIEAVGMNIDRNWMFFSGSNGLGKTHLAVAIVRELVHRNGYDPMIVRWSEYCSKIQHGWSDRSAETEAQLWRSISSAGILIVDDLDKKSMTEWALGKLFDLTDFRYVHRLPTIITGNRSLDRLAAMWDTGGDTVRDLAHAIVSRIVGQLAYNIQLEGEDFRWRR